MVIVFLKKNLQPLNKSKLMSFTIRILSLITAIFFLFLALFSFVPYAVIDGRLFGWMAVNPPLNFFHLFTALAAAAASYSGDKVPFAFFRIFGFVYLFMGVLGLLHFGYPLLGFIANSFQGNFFHTLVGCLFILVSFLTPASK